jgi:hypothetical protein
MNETSQPQLKILEKSVIMNTSRKLTYTTKTPKTNTPRTRIKTNSSQQHPYTEKWEYSTMGENQTQSCSGFSFV